MSSSPCMALRRHACVGRDFLACESCTSCVYSCSRSVNVDFESKGDRLATVGVV